MAKFLTKLHLACSGDSMRPALQHVYFKDGYAYATNAHVLVKQKLEHHGFTEEDVKAIDGMAVHVDLFKEVYKANMFAVREHGLECFNKSGISMMVPFVEGLQFPNVEAVIPKTEPEKLSEIRLSPKYLSLIKDLSLNPNSVDFTFYGKNRGVIITGVDHDEVILIMPITKY